VRSSRSEAVPTFELFDRFAPCKPFTDLDTYGELPRFENSRVSNGDDIRFLPCVKLVRDLGNSGKSGTGTLDHLTSNHAERALPASGTKRISTRHFMAAAIRLSITREWPS
jgi:hypothetical protein